MIPSVTYEDIIKILGNEICTQAVIERNMMKNATSVRGSDLAKKLSSTETNSINLRDTFIIFELIEDNDASDDVSINEPDDTANLLMRYDFNLKIYGNSCHQTAQTIMARLKSHEIAMKLYSKGIWLIQVTFPQAVNEFINDTLYPRADMTIKIKVRHNIPFLEKTGYIENISELKIKTVK